MKANSNEYIDKAFKRIEDNFKRIGQQHKDELEAALIKPIHPKFPYAQNGICAMIASMGSGKSYNYLKSIAKQEVLQFFQWIGGKFAENVTIFFLRLTFWEEN